MSSLALDSTVDVFVATYIFDALRHGWLNGDATTGDAELVQVPTHVVDELAEVAALWVSRHHEVPADFAGVLFDELVQAWIVLREAPSC